jgi:hypothetical protein
MAPASETTAAFDELLAALAAARDRYVLDPERGFSELEAVEGFRYLLHLVSEGSELFAEGDPDRPRFSSIVSPARKFLGDNPDAIYHQAVIRDDRSYRIRGRLDGQTYLSFTVHGAGGFQGPVLADINDRDLVVGADGRFELVLGPDERPGTWVRLPTGGELLIVRSYYSGAVSAQNDPERSVHLAIEALDEPGPAPPLDDATFAGRLRTATAFVQASTTGMRVFGTPSQVPFVSNEPNTVGRPWSFRSSEIAAAGAVDIWYSSGSFALGPDDALVMEGVLPACAFVNVMAWNVHMQTLEYRSRRSSLNGDQIEAGSDGSYRVVVSAKDPHVPNWIDVGGHERGTIFWRFLLPEEEPQQPRCRVVPVTDLAPASLGG